jgi:hypothetical protein
MGPIVDNVSPARKPHATALHPRRAASSRCDSRWVIALGPRWVRVQRSSTGISGHRRLPIVQRNRR